MTPQLNFVYVEKHPDIKKLNAPTIMHESGEAAYIEDGKLRSAFQTNSTILKVGLTSLDKRRLFTIYTKDFDKAKDTLINYARSYKHSERA